MSAIFGETLTFGQTKRPRRVPEGVRRRALCPLRGPERVHGGLRRGRRQFCYARPVGGRFRSTGVPLSQPPPRGLVRHLQESAAIVAKARARRATPRRVARQAPSEGRAHVRSEPGAARRPRAVDRARSRADHPGQLPGRDQHRDSRRRGGDAERRELHPQRQHLLGTRVLPARVQRQARLHQRRRRPVYAEPRTASSTSTTCSSRRRCNWPSPTGSI